MNNLTPLRNARAKRGGATWRIVLISSVLLAALPLVGTAPGRAAETAEPEWSVDVENTAAPSGSMYARVRHLVGTVELLQEDEMQEAELTLNTAVAAGDVVSSGNDSIVEVQLTDGTLVRLDEYTRMQVMALADLAARYENRTILALEGGTLSIQVGDFDPEEKMIRVDTDAATIFLLTDGLFRIDVNAGGGTRVTSKRGVAEILAAETSTLVRSGEMSFVAPGHGAEGPRMISTRPRDDFDRYVEERRLTYLGHTRGRDRAHYEDDLPAPVRPYAVELGTYGEWHDHSSYGVIWVPRVAVGWRPYASGRWQTRPVGHVWVSSDPWGYAPYHYGRWEYLPGYGWSWLPGAVYAPAWVAYGYHDDQIGWAPLGYYDYPSGWSISIGFGAFHASYWSFVDYDHFHHNNVQTVFVRHGHIVADRVHYASRPPRVRRDDVRNRRTDTEFHRAAREATPVTSVARAQVDLRVRGRDFRRRETTQARPARRTTDARPVDGNKTDTGVMPTRERGGRVVGDTTDRTSTPTRRSPALSGTSPRDRRATDVRGRSRTTARGTQAARDGGQASPRGSGKAATPQRTDQVREPGRTAPSRAAPERTTRRPVAESGPRRLIKGTRTRRTQAVQRTDPRRNSSATEGASDRRPSSADTAPTRRRDNEATTRPQPTAPRRDPAVRRPTPKRSPQPSAGSRRSSSRRSGASAERSAPKNPAPPKRSGSGSEGRSGSKNRKKDDSGGDRLAAAPASSQRGSARSARRPSAPRAAPTRQRSASSRPAATPQRRRRR